MLTTTNAEWDRQFRYLRQHGMSVPDTTRHSAQEVIFESYLTLGYNYRMTDIQAAVGREQLKRVPEMVARRRQLQCQYEQLLRAMPNIASVQEPEWAHSNWQSYGVRLGAAMDQRQVMQKMLDSGVPTRRGIMCAHREPAYESQTWSCGTDRKTCGCAARTCASLERSEEAQERVILLPIFHDMTDADQIRVVQALRRACA